VTRSSATAVARVWTEVSAGEDSLTNP
jgi:hypothetical protein